MKRPIKGLLIFLLVCLTLGTVTASAATKKPEQPTIKSVTMKGASTAQIKWTKAKNAQKYELYVSVDGSEFKKLKTVNAQTYTHKNLTEGSTYKYKVRGVNGKKKGKFSKVKKIKVPAHEHTVVIDPAVEATCTSKGKTEGSHCSTCGKVLKAQKTVAKLDHTSVVDPAEEATCTKKGKTEGSHCSVCGKVLVKQKEVPMTDHTIEIDPAVEPTTTSTGLTEGSHCSVCGKVIVKQTVVPVKKMTTWDYYMLLKDEMISGGHVNTSGNPLIPFTDSSEGVTAGIVYSKSSDSFSFIFNNDYDSSSVTVRMDVSKSDVKGGVVDSTVIYLYPAYSASFEAVTSLIMATYNGSNASFTIKNSSGISGLSASKINNLAQSCLKAGFATWAYMLTPYKNKGIDMHSLGFTSYGK